MNTFAKPALLAALIVPGVAFAGLEIGQIVGTQENEIRAALTDMGYTVQDIEFEKDEIEAEVTLDGVAYEIELAVDTGAVIEIELEDDEDGDDD